MDPTRRRSGGALLGDRIRMNSLSADNIYMRSLATRRAHLATAAVLKDVIELYQAAGFDLAIVETAGIGQSDSRSEEHTSELQSQSNLVCRLLLEKKKQPIDITDT